MALELNGTTGVSLVQDGVVNTTDLADSAVTEAKIASSAVTTAKIASSAVTAAKLASGAAASNLGNYVTSVNGSTGAVTVASAPTTINAVGGTMRVFYAVTGTGSPNVSLFISVNTTIAGSSLRYNPPESTGDGLLGASNGYIAAVRRQLSSVYAGGGSALSGTWRCLENAVWFRGVNTGDGVDGYWMPVLFVRIS